MFAIVLVTTIFEHDNVLDPTEKPNEHFMDAISENSIPKNDNDINAFIADLPELEREPTDQRSKSFWAFLLSRLVICSVLLSLPEPRLERRPRLS